MFSGLVSGKARVQRLEQEGKTIVLTVKTVPENLDRGQWLLPDGGGFFRGQLHGDHDAADF